MPGVILLSDGGDTGLAQPVPASATELPIFTVGVGTAAGRRRDVSVSPTRRRDTSLRPVMTYPTSPAPSEATGWPSRRRAELERWDARAENKTTGVSAG